MATRISTKAIGEVIADSEGVRDRGQGRVHRADAREEAGVDDVEVVHLVGLQFTSRAELAGSVPNRTVPAWCAVAPIGMPLCR